MSKRKKVKPVKAWALVPTSTMRIHIPDICETRREVVNSKKACYRLGDDPDATVIIPVLITPIPTKAKKTHTGAAK